MSIPWSKPGANPLADIRVFMREAEQQRPAPFAVLAPPPLGCPDCWLALPDCHQRHGEAHCGQHDREVCAWARGEPDA